MTGATEVLAVDSVGAAGFLAGVCVPELELSAVVTGLRALVPSTVFGVDAGVCVLATGLTAGTDAAADVAAEIADVGAAVAGGELVTGAELVAGAAGLLALGPVPEPEAAAVTCAADVAVEVAADATVEVADVALEVTVLVAGDATGVVAGGGVAAAELVVAVVSCAVEARVEVAVDVAVEMSDVTAEVSVLVTGDEAGLEVVAVAGGVAACAWRENTSKTTRIAAARIANCATR
jgi:hypothetical protein